MNDARLDPQILTFYCDEITGTLISDTVCLQSHALVGLDELETNADIIDPMAVFIDAVRATPASVESALSALEKKWPYSIRFVLVAVNDDEALDLAFSQGANEVLRKPIRPQELLARLRARLKDAADLKRVHQVNIGDVIVDQKLRKIHRGELSSQLSQLSFDVLMCLADMPRLVVPRADIKRRGWRDIHVADGSLDRQMHELRKSLSDVGSELAIKAVYGEGYMLS